MHAENFAIGFVRHNLDESVVLAHDARLAVGQERKLPDFHLASLRAGLRLREEFDAADAGIGIGGASQGYGSC